MIINTLFLIPFKALYIPFNFFLVSASKIKKIYILKKTVSAIEKGFKRAMKKLAQVYSAMSFESYLTKKPNGSRIGKGKGPFFDNFTRVKNGSALFRFKNKLNKVSTFSISPGGKASNKLKLRISFFPATKGFFTSLLW